MRWRLEQNIRSNLQKHITKSASNFKHECALVSRIHVSFGINQQLTSCRVTITRSVMQSGAMATRTEHQKQSSKTQYNSKSASNYKHECAPVYRIHISFGINQQLASCRVTITGSNKQSGAMATRTEHQKQSSKTQHKISIKLQT